MPAIHRWSRAHHAAVRDSWVQALLAGRLRVPPAVRLEILLSARSGADFDVLAERPTAIRTAPLTATTARAAQDAMRTLAEIMGFESVWLAPSGSLP